jgi:hypothetical protein
MLEEKDLLYLVLLMKVYYVMEEQSNVDFLEHMLELLPSLLESPPDHLKKSAHHLDLLMDTTTENKSFIKITINLY